MLLVFDFRIGFTESGHGQGIRHHVHLLADWRPRIVRLQNGKVDPPPSAFKRGPKISKTSLKQIAEKMIWRGALCESRPAKLG